MMKTTLYLTRHGETQWNVEKKMQGHLDSPLTERGVQQAIWLRDALRSIDFAAIHASSSPRTQRTAELLRHQRNCALTLHDSLREMHMGHWEGLTQAIIQQKHLAAYQAFWETPHQYQPENGGESFVDLRQRVVPLIETLLAQHQGQTILLVTHAGPLKMLLAHFQGRPLAHLWHPPIVHPTSLSKVVVENQQASIELYGDISHYQDESV